MQTQTEIMEICKTWRPPNGLIIDESEIGHLNGLLMKETLHKFFAGVYSHQNLDAVVAKLNAENRLAYNVKVVEKRQTQEEVNEVFRLWCVKHAPKTLILAPGDARTDVNVKAINTYVKTYHAGLYTITSLNDAAANADGLEHVSAQELRDIATGKERDKMRKDYVDSIRDRGTKRNFEQEARDHEEAKQNAAKQEGAKARINKLINGYIANRVNGPGQDFGLTETRQAELRRIAASEKDAVKALARVEARLMEYPG